jgi:undecaprenyl pyrophosphate synthase
MSYPRIGDVARAFPLRRISDISSHHDLALEAMREALRDRRWRRRRGMIRVAGYWIAAAVLVSQLVWASAAGPLVARLLALL